MFKIRGIILKMRSPCSSEGIRFDKIKNAYPIRQIGTKIVYFKIRSLISVVLKINKITIIGVNNPMRAKIHLIRSILFSLKGNISFKISFIGLSFLTINSVKIINPRIKITNRFIKMFPK